jgi:hypothetical protein
VAEAADRNDVERSFLRAVRACEQARAQTAAASEHPHERQHDQGQHG